MRQHLRRKPEKLTRQSNFTGAFYIIASVRGKVKEENKMKYYAVIEHDNGKPGQKGFTDWTAESREEAERIAADEARNMTAAGIVVYSVHVGAY